MADDLKATETLIDIAIDSAKGYETAADLARTQCRRTMSRNTTGPCKRPKMH